MQSAVAFVDELPRVQITGGIAYTEILSGGLVVSRTALAVDQFIRNVEVCNEAIRAWEAAGRACVVVELPTGAERLERQIDMALAKH